MLVPEKLESLEHMPPPQNPKEVKQFLGLAGYYRKFVPQFADIAHPLNALTRKGVEFIWTEVCQESFKLLKQKLLEKLILVYPDPNKPYVLFTGTSKYAWSCVLTQEYIHTIDGKEVKVLHPITYMSGLFKGNQINWTCLIKETYAIYMSVKKLAYYLGDADVTLRSDHLPLWKFLEQNMLNLKVNRWAIEMSPYCIHFQYIKGIKNTLADTMSQLIKINAEPYSYEYGCYMFEDPPALQAVTTRVNEIVENLEV